MSGRIWYCPGELVVAQIEESGQMETENNILYATAQHIPSPNKPTYFITPPLKLREGMVPLKALSDALTYLPHVDTTLRVNVMLVPIAIALTTHNSEDIVATTPKFPVKRF